MSRPASSAWHCRVSRFSLLDERRQPVADDEPGEIYVSGTGLARAHLGASDLTAERFVTDPATGRRSYRSGDLARRRPNGILST